MQGETTFVSVGSALQHADGSAVAEKTSATLELNQYKLSMSSNCIDDVISSTHLSATKHATHSHYINMHITLHNIQNHTSSIQISTSEPCDPRCKVMTGICPPTVASYLN